MKQKRAPVNYTISLLLVLSISFAWNECTRNAKLSGKISSVLVAWLTIEFDPILSFFVVYSSKTFALGSPRRKFD